MLKTQQNEPQYFPFCNGKAQWPNEESFETFLFSDGIYSNSEEKAWLRKT